MSVELSMLMAAAILCALQMFPYAVAYYRHWGVDVVFADRSRTPALPVWAERAQRAHHNMVENLVHFIPLVLVLELTQSHSRLSALACVVFVVARTLYVPLYILGVKWWRSVSYTLGLAAEGVLVAQLFPALVTAT